MPNAHHTQGGTLKRTKTGKKAAAPREEDYMGVKNRTSGAHAHARTVQGGAMPGSAGNQGILLLARMAQVCVCASICRSVCLSVGASSMCILPQLVDAEDRRDSKKRKAMGAGAKGATKTVHGGDEGVGTVCAAAAESGDREVIFKYLTPSDLRLTAEALVSTKVSHFRCNLNGCSRYASLCIFVCLVSPRVPLSLSLSLSLSHTYTHTHTHTHTHSLTLSLSHTHTHTHALNQASSHPQPLSHK